MSLGLYLMIMISNLCLLFSAEIGRLSDIETSDAKQDSMIWVANPVADKSMEPDDVLEIDISYSFDWEPDSIEFYSIDVSVIGVSSVSPIDKAYFKTAENMLRIETKPDIYGYAYIQYTANTSFGTATDEFLVRVEDPSYEWRSNGSNFSFSPENCIGSGSSEWKAASVFDFGTSRYDLNIIEFGYGRDGSAEWEIVTFDGTPTNSVLYSGSVDFKGDYSTFIENISAELTGKVAVVFKTNSNFMSTDPSGDSGKTWIFTETLGWSLLSGISPDYEGAWYIRLLILDPTGIQQEFTSGAIKNYTLLQNYPNPFNSQTVISWDMRKSGQAVINIHNLKGELVREYNEGSLNKGYHSILFDSSGLNSGVYYYDLTIDGISVGTKKMLYLK